VTKIPIKSKRRFFGVALLLLLCAASFLFLPFVAVSSIRRFVPADSLDSGHPQLGQSMRPVQKRISAREDGDFLRP
jgi:hypothetical protein